MNTLKSFWQWYCSNQNRSVSNIDITFISKRNCHQLVIDYIDIKWYLFVPYSIDFVGILQYQNDVGKFMKLFIEIVKRVMVED